MLDDLAAMIDNKYPADIAAVAEVPVRGDREAALRWTRGEVEVSYSSTTGKLSFNPTRERIK